ncbi:hypothetical protein FACS18949_14800 [Clostridia bacterium]|nr:hypothetical protein FACS189425_04960 [Clostridia bacterium]GHV35950.1 hypothetical protein FACS18949_14800 [Clostridia bacterium]
MSQKDTQSRKWQLTLNNPINKGYTHANIEEALRTLKALVYFCMADEEAQTPHTHIFIAADSAIRFSTVKRLFPEAHIEPAHGSSKENRDYISKSGKWENDAKHGTKIEGTFEEWGDMPNEKQGQRNDLKDIYDALRDGKTAHEIVQENPTLILQSDKIERARQFLLNEQYKLEFRKLDVSYVFGRTATGKTRFIMETYGYDNVYRTTSYRNCFDRYNGQKVLLLDEFRGELPLSFMLNVLDGYPLSLNARYTDRQACYDKVFIVSNEDLRGLYTWERLNQRDSYEAFLRRIHHVIVYTGVNQFTEYDTYDYLHGFHELPSNTWTPFDGGGVDHA